MQRKRDILGAKAARSTMDVTLSLHRLSTQFDWSGTSLRNDFVTSVICPILCAGLSLSIATVVAAASHNNAAV